MVFFEPNKKLKCIGAKASGPVGVGPVCWWLVQASCWGGCGWLVGCMCVVKVGGFEQFPRGDLHCTLAEPRGANGDEARLSGRAGGKFWHFEVAWPYLKSNLSEWGLGRPAPRRPSLKGTKLC